MLKLYLTCAGPASVQLMRPTTVPFLNPCHSSRLASNITLSCKTGDILVSLGDLAPWKTL